MQAQHLTKYLLASLSQIGDIFTDAPECANSVRGAQNLAILAGMLSSSGEVVMTGEFKCGDESFDAAVRADCTVCVDDDNFELQEVGVCYFEAPNGRKYELDVHTLDDCVAFVIRDARAFYEDLMD